MYKFRAIQKRRGGGRFKVVSKKSKRAEPIRPSVRAKSLPFAATNYGRGRNRVIQQNNVPTREYMQDVQRKIEGRFNAHEVQAKQNLHQVYKDVGAEIRRMSSDSADMSKFRLAAQDRIQNLENQLLNTDFQNEKH